MKTHVLIFTALMSVAFFSACVKEQPNASCLPIVLTNEVTEVGTHSVLCCCSVTELGDKPINVRGICWGVNHNPTTADNFVKSDVYLKSDSLGLGDFKIRLSGLAANETYYVRAFASCSNCVSYGNELGFNTQSYGSEVPEGGINALFSINENGDKVWFSKGNLQYQASTDTWRFAENQWEVCDEDIDDVDEDSHITADYVEGSSVWIDLFGWGTSGYDHGAAYYQPWSTSTYSEGYYAYGQYDCNLNDNTGMADWGYNAISNGGNVENSGWRTLTKGEWDYLLNDRPNADRLCGQGQVNEMKGFIFLPDDWCIPSGLSFTPGISKWANSYTDEQWLKMETAGAVFLPAAGMRNNIRVHGVGGFGAYWSSSSFSNNNSYYDSYKFHYGYTYVFSHGIALKSYGYSVRLVRAAE